jgi:O-antigen/teichoic acid export membrane protein
MLIPESVVAVTALVLSALLIPHWALQGAAWALLGTSVVSLVVFSAVLARILVRAARAQVNPASASGDLPQ